MDPTKIPPEVLASYPALAPPPGVQSNFVDPPSIANQTRHAIYACLPIMVTFLVLRLYTRLRILRAVGPDDYLVITAALCVGAQNGVMLHMLGNPLGPHQWNVPLSKITEDFLKSSFTGICLYALSAIFVKSTLLVLYLRIFRPIGRAVWMIWGGIFVICIFYISCIVVNIVLCVPRKGESGWLSPQAQGRCAQPELELSAAQGVFSTISDFYVLFIPIQLISTLRMPLGRKIGVIGIFLTGLMACVCSVAGTVYRFQQRVSADFTYKSIAPYTLAVLELNVGIICSCMPVVFAMFKSIKKSSTYGTLIRYFRTRTRSNNRNLDESSNPAEDLPEKKSAKLPQIPKPTMTGLMSFVRGGHVSRQGHTTEMSTYSELESVNVDYNESVKQTWSRDRV